MIHDYTRRFFLGHKKVFKFVQFFLLHYEAQVTKKIADNRLKKWKHLTYWEKMSGIMYKQLGRKNLTNHLSQKQSIFSRRVMMR